MYSRASILIESFDKRKINYKMFEKNSHGIVISKFKRNNAKTSTIK